MISTHILDISLGQPAQNVTVRLEKLNGAAWDLLSEEKTNSDGRIEFQCLLETKSYRLVFLTESYFKKNDITPFFLSTPVVFQVQDLKRKYHIPLLLSPFGYSTYRGS